MPDLGTIALTAGMIVAGASGAQWIHTPEAWPRNWDGFGQRVADRAGYVVVQASSYVLFERGLGYRQDATTCPRERLLRCGFARTFTAFDRNGVRRAHVPLLASVIVGSGVSLAWRPERSEPAKSWAFVGSRIGIGLAGQVAKRIVGDWWVARTAARDSPPAHPTAPTHPSSSVRPAPALGAPTNSRASAGSPTDSRR
jgi:hypothetical protein